MRGFTPFGRFQIAATVLSVACAFGPAAAATDPESCKQVRTADVGWTDITLTTTFLASILEGLGYEPEVNVLGTQVVYQAMANDEIDVFLGTWIPGLERAVAPYYENGTIETVRRNLEGAKFTLAVPRYVSEAGVESFADLAKHKQELEGKIYGVEPGGNKPIEAMIAQNAFGLGNWKLVESSEQGMLTEVRRAVKDEEWIVFLAWAPHPMNKNFDIAYLSGGDEFYGADYGASYVNTDVRKGYLSECPNVALLLENLAFTVEMENELMGYTLDDGMEPEEAMLKWLRNNPEWLEVTLRGVTTIDGKDGIAAVRNHLDVGA